MGNGLLIRCRGGRCICSIVGTEGRHIEWLRRRRTQRVGGHPIGRVGGHRTGRVGGHRVGRHRIGRHRIGRVGGHWIGWVASHIERVRQVPRCPHARPFEIFSSIVVKGVLHHVPEHFDGIGEFDLALLDLSQPLEDLVPELGGRHGH